MISFRGEDGCPLGVLLLKRRCRKEDCNRRSMSRKNTVACGFSQSLMENTLQMKTNYFNLKRGPVYAVALGFFGVLAGQGLLAQESIRPSSTGDMAAEARREVVLPTNYNIKAGPLLLDLTGRLEIEANDNVGLSETDREFDVIVRPEIRFNSFWQITRFNTLELSIGLGFAKYLLNTSADTSGVLVDPGTQISFDFYVGNWRINLHDRFAVLQNPIDEIGLSGVANFDRIQNAIGVQAVGDYNDMMVVLGYDHYNFWSLSGEFEYLDRAEEQVYASVSFDVSSAHRVGVDLHGSFVNYDQDFNNDGTTYGAGVFWEVTLSNYIKMRIAGGYQGMSFDGGGANGDSGDYNGYYANFMISQRLNAYWTHALTAGHEARLGLSVNYDEFDYARYNATWAFSSKFSLGMNAFVENSNESTGFASESSFRLGGGFSFGYQINRRTALTFAYQYVNKDSDEEFRSYYQNRAVIGISYDF